MNRREREHRMLLKLAEMEGPARIKFGRELLSDLLELRNCTIRKLATSHDISPNQVLALINEALACDEAKQ